MIRIGFGGMLKLYYNFSKERFWGFLIVITIMKAPVVGPTFAAFIRCRRYSRDAECLGRSSGQGNTRSSES